MLELQLKTYANTFDIEGAEAAAVLAAVKAHKDATFTQTGGGGTGIITVPYSSVHYVMYANALTDEAAEDDNCKVRTPETTPKGLTIVGGEKLDNVTITVTLGDTSINGTYGDLTFTDGVATVTISTGQTITTTGLPDGISYTISGEDVVADSDSSLTGTTPGTASVTGLMD